MLGTAPDLLRLLAVPAFGWAAYRDLRTRRVPNVLWYPLAALGAVLLAWEAATVGGDPVAARLFAVRVAVSLGVVVPLAYLFWRVGGFGGADAKAFMVLAVLLPTYPTYYLPTTSLPVFRPTLGVFSLSVLTNAVVLGAAYPLALAARNALAGRVSKLMFVGTVVGWRDLPDTAGRLLEDGDGYTRQGLDLDALRMYLRWRGVTLAELRADPGLRDPATLPAEPNDPTDGAVRADGGNPDAAAARERVAGEPSDADPSQAVEDPWGAAAFLADLDGSAYGTTPETLRDGLDLLVEREAVWVSPGIPFMLPLFVGLVAALSYGDLLVAALSASGLA